MQVRHILQKTEVFLYLLRYLQKGLLQKNSSRVYLTLALLMSLGVISALNAQNVAGDDANALRTPEIETSVVLEVPSPFHPNDPIEVRPPFESGEQLNFKVKYLGLNAGYASISTRPLDDSRIQFKLTARTAKWVEGIYRLRVTMLSESLLSTYQTLRYTEDKQEKNFYFSNTQLFHPERKEYTYRYIKNEKFREKTVDYAALEGGLSILGAFFFARTAKLEEAAIVYTNCFFQDTTFQVGVETVKTRRISTAFGKRETIVIRPLLKDGALIEGQEDMLIYLSNDSVRIPLRVDIFTTFGPVRINLISYQSSATN